MPKVIVNPPSVINVRVGSSTQPRVSGTSVFTGASVQEAQQALILAQAAYNEANTALIQINTVYNEANIAYALAANSLPITGGEITGNLIVDQTFTATVDGGRF